MTLDGRALVARERSLQSERSVAGADRAASSAENALLALQRGAGNRAVANLLGRQAVIRRACACGGHSGGGEPCAGCAAHEEEDEAARALRRAPVAPEAPDGELAPDVRSYLGRSRGHGRPLEPMARRSLERSFGRGLGGVRVHTGPTAAWAARSIRARAFALGRDIWFGAGEYRPGDVDGRRLLAHEVAHTLDEPGHVSLESVRVGRVDDVAESRADRAAEAAVHGRRVATVAGPAGGIRRTPEAVVRRTATAEAAPARKPKPATASVVRRAPARGGASPSTQGGTPAAVAPWGTCDRPAHPLHGPGTGEERPVSALRFFTSTVLGVRFWELRNFDVDRSFVKTEHEKFIHDELAPALKEMIDDYDAHIAIVGEASTTAPQTHNLPLSKRRAACVSAVVKRELLSAGVTDLSNVLAPTGIGEVLSRVRHLGLDEFEDKEDRKVTIVAVRQQPCSIGARTRRSQLFHVKLACESPLSVAINIGDVSDPLEPTYRRFRWLHEMPEGGCRFVAASNDDAMFGTRTDLRLATRDPDDPSDRSDFQGDALLDSTLEFLIGAKGLYHVKLKGTWTPPTCKTSAGDLPGVVMPIGPVECGEVPSPPKGQCEPKEGDCTEADRTAGATKFGAVLTRAGKDVKDLPWVGKFFRWLPFSPEVGAAAVMIGTLEGPGPRIARAFVFAYGGVGGTGATLDKQAGVAKEATSSKPLRLATHDPGSILSPSDFDAGFFSPAKLVVKGGHTSKEELEIGGMTFSFSGKFCNHGGGRNLHGVFHGTSPVWCMDISPLTQYVPDPNCEEECPADRQLAGHKRFKFRTGRATLSSLPVVGRRLADAYGCEIVASFLNIGAETDSPGERIYREFLFVGRPKECGFDIAKKDWIEGFILDRQLSTDDPDDRFDLSDFAGAAFLNDKGELRLIPAAIATPFSFPLPGAFDAACKGEKGATGLIVPLDDVKCGDVPEPSHSTAVDRVDLKRCRDYAAANPFVAHEVAELKKGTYDNYVALVTHPPGLVYPEIDDLPKWKGQTLPDVRLVGRSGISGFPKVVTFVDIEVVDFGRDPVTGRLWVGVRFVSDACSYDENGKAVFVSPVDCVESLPQKGGIGVLRSEPVEKPTPTPTPTTKPAEEEIHTA